MKILTHRSCIVSAKLLRDALTPLLGLRRPIRVTTNAARVRGPFIRYGSAAPVAGPDTQFNSQAFVSLASNKAAFSHLLRENDIPTPVFHRTTRPTQYPVLIRKTLNASGGRGIVVCPDKATFDQHWDDAYVWTPFVKTQFELRVHVLGGKVVKVLKKRYVGTDGVEEGEELTEPALPIRNLDKGYHYSARELTTYPKVHTLVAALDPIIKGRFYTLDIGWDKVKQRYFVFEANSGSGLNTQTVELYADYLARAIMS